MPRPGSRLLVVTFAMTVFVAILLPREGWSEHLYANHKAGYAITVPDGRWEVEPAENEHDIQIVRNFPKWRYGSFGALPAKAEIRIVTLPSATDEYAHLREISRFGRRIQWSTNPTAISFTEDGPASGTLRVCIIVDRKASKLFDLTLQYHEGDKRAAEYERIAKQVFASISPLPQAEPSAPR